MDSEATVLASRTVLIRTNRPLFKDSWLSLPSEIRLMILGYVAAKPTGVKVEATQGQQKMTIAKLATICLEWQSFFEKHTFRRLVLEPSTLTYFAKSVNGKNAIRLGYIRFIWLRIKLSEYDCPSCTVSEDEATIASNNRIFTDSITELMKALSSWKSGCHSGGLTLQITAHSPSDGMHQFISVEMEDDYPFQLEEDLGRVPSLSEYHDIRIEEILQRPKSHRRTALTRGHLDRSYGTPLDLRLRNMPNLPKAPIVRGLFIRALGFRSVAAKTFAKLFRESLTELVWFRIQRWTPIKREYEDTFFQGMTSKPICYLLFLEVSRSFRSTSGTTWMYLRDAYI
ncbi:hypothetical protein B0J13DRAFT_635842 [Dactylonectria estremocensis]|uniref:F-box domain-containing protein n=1 Tax=Dactylonectria estremocensis TaxID=1079267 RepID=A0A9P9EU94_9HYPO|nr:hypothetical protein B0J13DRAFT_635842 [Dactylonectria estremocensis]